MMRFTVVSIDWTTKRFVDAAHETGKYKLTVIYSRGLEQAQAFVDDYPAEHLSTSFDELAQNPDVDAVYTTSPNSLHFPQTRLFLSRKRHVICEKPLTSDLQEAEVAIALAKESSVVPLGAFKTASLPNFLLLEKTFPKMSKLHKTFINYCQYSSRYQHYLDGENPSTFNPAFSNGSIMNIGFYCLASAAALRNEPQTVLATASLLDGGVNAWGTVVLSYDDFDVTLHRSKVSDSTIPNEVQGEGGTLVTEKISECQRLVFVPHGGKAQGLTQPQHISTTLYEAETFVRLMETQDVSHPGLTMSRITAKLSSETRCQTEVIFPADTQSLAQESIKAGPAAIDESHPVAYSVTCKGEQLPCRLTVITTHIIPHPVAGQ